MHERLTAVWNSDGVCVAVSDSMLALRPKALGTRVRYLDVDGFYWWDELDPSGLYCRVYRPVGDLADQSAPPFVADIPMMMHSINPRGCLLTVTDTWLTELGYSRSEVLGHPSTEFLTPESQEYARSILRDFWTVGFCENVPYNLRRSDGSAFQVLLSAKAERLPCGRPRRSLAILRDTAAEVPHLGKYRLGSPLGEGAMGRVFGGTDPFGNEVVLKVAHGTSNIQPRVLREAAAMQSVSHPSIPAFHEVMHVKGQLIIVMDLADGVELTHRIHEGTHCLAIVSSEWSVISRTRSRHFTSATLSIETSNPRTSSSSDPISRSTRGSSTLGSPSTRAVLA